MQNAERKKQAQKVVSLSNSRFPAVDIGTNVVVRVSDLDRGRLAPRNVLAVVVDVSSSGLCLSGTKGGKLERQYARSGFSTLLHNYVQHEKCLSSVTKNYEIYYSLKMVN